MNDLTMWQDVTRDDEIHVYMVDPHNLDIVRGELSGIMLDKTSLTEGYYVDTRISGKLSILEGNYIEDSWLRIIHSCPGYSYENELGTFVVDPSSVSESYISGTKITSFDLKSVLWAISNHACASHFTIGEGAYATDAFSRICDATGRAYIFQSNVSNYRYSAAKVFDMGAKYLSDLFDICGASNNRLDCDTHGRISFGLYTVPSNITPSWYLDSDDPRTIVLASEHTKSPSGTAYGESIVIHTNGDTEICASAQVSSDSPSSFNRRGYMASNVHQVSDLTPESQGQAQALANSYVNEDSDSTSEWTLSCLYFPCHQGQVIAWHHDGITTKGLVKSIDPINLDSMTLKLNLKEV